MWETKPLLASYLCSSASSSACSIPWAQPRSHTAHPLLPPRIWASPSDLHAMVAAHISVFLKEKHYESKQYLSVPFFFSFPFSSSLPLIYCKSFRRCKLLALTPMTKGRMEISGIRQKTFPFAIFLWPV